jgi:hypothetical protein
LASMSRDPWSGYGAPEQRLPKTRAR